MLARLVLGVAVFAAAVAVVAAQRPPLRSGLDPSTLDASVRPQDDLFRYVNNRWIASTDIPPDKVAYGTMVELADRAELELQGVIDAIIATPNRKPGSEAQQIADLYASMMDVETIERLGAASIRTELQKIDAIATPKALATEAGYLSSIGSGGPFDGTVGVSVNEPGTYTFQLVQGGTLLSDRDYYLREDAATADLRAKYLEYLTTIFTLAGRPNATGDARAVFALEAGFARAQLPRTDNWNTATRANRFSLKDLPAAMPGFDWLAWARPQGLDRVKYLILSQPSFFTTFAALVGEAPLETTKAWLAARYLTASAPSLSRAFDDARFGFFGKVLLGQDAPRPRWKRAVGIVSAELPDAIGKRYVETRFPPAAKARADKLVATVVEAFRRSLTRADWLSAGTRREALAKLTVLDAKVGYPDDWRSYRGLEIKPDDLVGNQKRWRLFENMRRMDGLNTGTDRRAWLIAPQVVNAYYNPVTNEIVLPAAILQPPLFDPDADDAANYGGIGAIIAHELGHAFDSHGRRYDARGNPRDWWTAADVAAFDARTRPLVEEFNACSPLAGAHADGQRTLDENIGDLGGLAVAFDAYRLSLGGKPAPVLDGLTGDQRFFLGWARAWRMKSTDGYVRQQLLLDPHAPVECRTNLVLGHMSAFVDAFGVRAGDRLFREDKARVHVW